MSSNSTCVCLVAGGTFSPSHHSHFGACYFDQHVILLSEHSELLNRSPCLLVWICDFFLSSCQVNLFGDRLAPTFSTAVSSQQTQKTVCSPHSVPLSSPCFKESQNTDQARGSVQHNTPTTMHRHEDRLLRVSVINAALCRFIDLICHFQSSCVQCSG